MSTSPGASALATPIQMCEQCWHAHGNVSKTCTGCNCHNAPDEICKECQTWTLVAHLTLGYCPRCVSLFKEQGRWCEKHGPTLGYCLGEKPDQAKESRAINRLRGPSAVDRLIAGLDRDSEEATGRIKGVLSLCGRDLTDSETVRVRAQVRAELTSLIIKATNEINQEWFDLVAGRQLAQ